MAAGMIGAAASEAAIGGVGLLAQPLGIGHGAYRAAANVNAASEMPAHHKRILASRGQARAAGSRGLMSISGDASTAVGIVLMRAKR